MSEDVLWLELEIGGPRPIYYGAIDDRREPRPRMPRKTKKALRSRAWIADRRRGQREQRRIARALERMRRDPVRFAREVGRW